ncbi:MAG: ABC transporter permease [Acidobacteriota bacterium]
MKSIRLHTAVLPAVLILVFGAGLPLLVILGISFAQRDAFGGIHYEWSWGNYTRAFGALYLPIYLRSLGLALLTTVSCLVLAFPLAYFMALQKKAWVKNSMVFLVTLPFWTSFLVRTYAWIILLRSEGLINSTLLRWGIISEPLNLMYNHFAIGIGLVYGELPFMILPLYAVLERLDKNLLDAAADLGSSGWRVFARVVLPLSQSGLWAGVLLVFIPALGAFITPDLLGGAKTLMVGNVVQSQFAVVRDQPFGSAVACFLTVIVLVLMWIGYRSARQSAEVRVL